MIVPFRRPSLGRLPIALIGSVAMLAIPAVAADMPAHPAAGMLRVQNVRIETGTPQEVAKATRAARQASGMRAYVDPRTGELRDPTPEEMQEGTTGTSKAASARAAITPMASARNSLIIPLDDSFLVNSVATRDASGKVQMQCVDGVEAASGLLPSRPVAKEHRHDR